ncbi:MAG: F0F1 ATP synthase subunit I [Rhizobiales bacterium]|nr:F0F1 ATP synthase subunit I [Hyphomicrobiales bacterium]MBA67695.1 F0F1 ATP synthase subunit I [Hyphomicrobiales bacterium]
MVDSKDADRRDATRAGGGNPEKGGDSLEARRKRLATELAARSVPETPEVEGREKPQGFALAVKLSSEFVAGVLVGALLGYLLDRFAGTTPWGMIVFLLLGFCAGVLNVLRSTGAVSTPVPGSRSGSAEQDKHDQ